MNKDENLMEELFEDFSEENKEEPKKEVKNNKTKIILSIIFLILLILIGYFGYNKFSNQNNSEKTIENQELEEINKEAIENNEKRADFDNRGEYKPKEKEFAELLIDSSWGTDSFYNVSNYWGEENLEKISDGVVKIFFPKGSYKPSAEPRGGAGFIYNFNKTYNKLSFSYGVEFDENFDFVKGGKLPGLCGGNCARGGIAAEDGFSTRFMWKRDGYLDVSKYSYNSDTYGDFIDKKIFKFIPGKKYNITQELTLNNPGKKDGILKIKVNGATVYYDKNFEIINDENIKIDGMLFATFFGGSDTTWATTIDTYITFSDFKISEDF